MPLVLADRVRDTTTTTGTGTITLSGTAPTGYQNFSVIGNGNTTYYTINAGSQWEVGIGTYSDAGPTLARTTVLESSNGGALVNFSAGVKDVFVTYPSDKSVNYDENNNVGIGTTTPGAKLSVATNTATAGMEDSFSVTNTVDSNVFIRVSGTANGDKKATIGPSTSTSLVFNTADTERMRITSAGNVGVGTSSPSERLQVSGAGKFSSNAASFAAGDEGTIIDFIPGVASRIGHVNGAAGSAKPLQFLIGGNPVMYLTAAGNLGIGTASPSYKLDVSGAIRNEGYLININGASTYTQFANDGGNSFINAVGAGNVGIGTASPATKLEVSTNSGVETLKVTQTDASGGTIARIRVSHGSGTQGVFEVGAGYGALGLTTSGPLVFSTNNLERARIDSAGNVGIGTSSPAYNLTVQRSAVAGNGVVANLNNPYGYGVGFGTAAATLQFTRDPSTGGAAGVMAEIFGGNEIEDTSTSGYLAFGTRNGVPNTTAERMRITSAGNVGIGTSSPGGKFAVVSGSSAGASISTWANYSVFGPNAGSSTGAAVGVSYNTGSDVAEIAAIAPGIAWKPINILSDSFRVTTNNAERMRIDSSGNVGIGTSSPNARLTVQGAAGSFLQSVINASEPEFALRTFNHGSIVNTTVFTHGLYYAGTENTAIKFYRGGGATGGFMAFTTDNGFERMRIDASGNVGIGTSTPSYVLNTSYNANATFTNVGSDFTQMWQNSGVNALGVALADDLTARFVANNGYAIAFNSATSELVRITSAGNVGIGTTSPTNKLVVEGGGNTQVNIAKAGTTGYLALGANSATVSQISAFRSDSPFVANLALNPDGGNVGIGTSAPDAKLHVSFSPPVSVPALGSGVGALALGPAANYGMLLGTTSSGNGYIQQQRFDATSTVYPLLLQPNGGNVGIGTSSPGAILDIQSNDPTIKLTDLDGTTRRAAIQLQTLGGDWTIEHDNDLTIKNVVPGGAITTGAYVSLGRTIGPLILGTSGTERMRIDSSGNVGIGTSSPSARLEVQGSTNTVRITNTDASAFAGVEFRDNAATRGQIWVGGSSYASFGGAGSINYSANSGPHVWYTNYSERMRIDSAGNVGIGTSSPGAKLSVVGTTKVGEGAASNTSKLMVNTVAGVAAGIQLFQDANESWIIQNPASTTALTFANSGTERMRITGPGDVGIGTTAPGARLDVRPSTNNIAQIKSASHSTLTGLSAALTYSRGNDGVTDLSAVFGWNNGGLAMAGREGLAFATGGGTGYSDTVERMRIDTSGNVGIGTSSPGYKLDVSGAGSTEIRVHNISSNADADIRMTNSVGSAIFGINATGQYLYTADAIPTLFYNNATERMRIDSSGRLLVGQTGPLNNGTIDVLGTSRQAIVARVTDNVNSVFQGFNAAATLISQIDGSGNGYFAGNVGIGTASPGSRLDVAGSQLIRGDSNGYALFVPKFGTDPFGGNYDRFEIRVDSGSQVTSLGNSNGGTGSPRALTFLTAATERMRIDSSGNVGIGTTSPSRTLSVRSGGLVAAEIVTTTSSSYLDIVDGSAVTMRLGSFGGVVGLAETATTVPTIAMVGGGVGIGTASPAYKLDVSASGNISGQFKTSGSINALYLADAGTTAGTLYVGTVGNDFRVVTGSNEQMRITSAGNVGIGITSPTYKLQVVAAGGTQSIFLAGQTGVSNGYTINSNGSALTHQWYSTGSESMRIDSSGYLLVNRVSRSSAVTAVRVETEGRYGSTVTGSAAYSFGTTGNAFTISDYSSGVSETERVRINSSGDVGIGTSAPSTRLTVAGTIRSTISGGTLDVSHDGINGSLASSSQLLLYANGANNMIFHTNGSQRLIISSTGAITSSDLADAVGYKGIPQNAQTASYTLALSDIGKHISITTGGVTIPANGSVAFPIGSAVTIYNNSASNQTISITTDTLRLAGTATTGSRTLAQRGICTVVKVTSTEWVISGAGLT